uniref:DUF674 family protein n=1 Tax=Cajanus cajan TaxID=3821 RepID=A0A151UCW0_CAJCA|nr:hypothetical protein KK1_021393 [Cajanus cajan]
MAEASGDFVDVLFSFLTLPLGTITRLEVEIGCIKNLYQSVRDLNPDVFWNKMCKEMLLFPHNPLEASCQRLKVNVDDTRPTKYFMCDTCSKSNGLLVSTFDGAACSCGKLMTNETELLKESREGDNGVFVKGDAMFLICDDLTVLESSPGNAVQPLRKYGLKDLSKIEEKSLQVDTDKMIRVLKKVLTSKTPLSDAFLEKESSPSDSFSRYIGPSNWKGSVEIKVMVSKSKKEILFAKEDGNFVDFLVSFLTTPLGSILNHMNGKLSLGSIDNLYASVKNLDSSWFIGSSKKLLLNPGVAPQFGCKSIQLNVLQEVHTPEYWYGTPVTDDKGSERKMISTKRDMLRDPAEMKLFEPRCCDGARERAVGFVKRPCTFVVSDDLEVKTTRNAIEETTTSITYLREMENLRLDDLEENSVKITKSHEVIFTIHSSFTTYSFTLLQYWCKKIQFISMLLIWSNN